jgi:hypothetical protein
MISSSFAQFDTIISSQNLVNIGIVGFSLCKFVAVVIPTKSRRFPLPDRFSHTVCSGHFLWVSGATRMAWADSRAMLLPPMFVIRMLMPRFPLSYCEYPYIVLLSPWFKPQWSVCALQPTLPFKVTISRIFSSLLVLRPLLTVTSRRPTVVCSGVYEVSSFISLYAVLLIVYMI